MRTQLLTKETDPKRMQLNQWFPNFLRKPPNGYYVYFCDPKPVETAAAQVALFTYSLHILQYIHPEDLKATFRR